MTISEHISKTLSNISAPHTFLLAVSGGSDSMVLLHAFSELKLQFEVAHVNYGFRKESSEEEDLVIKICRQNHIQYHTLQLDGYNDLEKSMYNNLQQYARDQRYEFFNKIKATRNLQYTVTAHHALDNTETVLMNIFHSTSFLGLRGMQILEKDVLRPFLLISKDQIETYAHTHQVDYYTDKSNLSSDYKRNFIRNEIIPHIETHIPDLKKNLNTNIHNWKSIIHFYTQMIQNHIQNLIKADTERGMEYFKYNKILRNPYCHDIIQLLLFRYHFNINQVPELLKLFSSKNGSSIQNKSYRLLKQNQLIYVLDLKKEECQYTSCEIDPVRLFSGDIIEIHTHTALITLQHIQNIDFHSLVFDKNNYYIHADTLSSSFTYSIRNVQQGDYIYPFGLNKKKKLNKYFIDKKIPIHLRPHQLVFTYDHYILSVIGHTIDHRFSCHEHTKQVIHIQIKE